MISEKRLEMATPRGDCIKYSSLRTDEGFHFQKHVSFGGAPSIEILIFILEFVSSLKYLVIVVLVIKIPVAMGQ